MKNLSYPLRVLSFVLYGAAWFMPALLVDLENSRYSLGWEAFYVGFASWRGIGHPTGILLFFAWLSNFVFLGYHLYLFKRKARPASTLLLIATLAASSVLFIPVLPHFPAPISGSDMFSGFGYGACVWVFAYGVLLVSEIRRAHDKPGRGL
jgi:hypothetical protein